MNSAVDKWLDDHFEEMTDDLKSLLKIRSLENLSEAKEGAPFGNKVRECLDAALSISSGLGLKSSDLNGYCGLIDAGEGEEMMGILSHIDVVPEGTGWDYDPYGAVIADGKLYGRGTLDDKGPSVAAMYALKAVCEAGPQLKKKVRIILGCNEETNMACLDYYLRNERIPDFSISPDSEYPLTNSEKSILRCTFEKKYDSKIKMYAGEAVNIVPGEAKAEYNGKEYYVKGVQSHASTPWEGDSALLKLIAQMDNENIGGEDGKLLKRLHECFKNEYYGESVGLDLSDESGRLTLNLGLMRWDENGMKLDLDLRCPTSVPEDIIKEKLEAVFEPVGAELVFWNYSQGYSIPDDSQLVQKLLNVFKDRTGIQDAKPLHIGGGTYARHLPNAVSFGPEGYMCTASCHVANEHIGLEQLLFNAKMIADAIMTLAC